jgi:ribosome biogenesis GTPase
MDPTNIKHYGLSDPVEQAAAEVNALPGRVVSQEKGMYRVVWEGGELLASVSGKFRYEASTALDYPATGDFVLLEPQSLDSGRGVIRGVLPRKSVFVRKAAGKTRKEQMIAANVDTVFVCMSLNNDFNLRRLERYLAVAWESGAAPVVVLTKSDLCDDIEAKQTAVEAIAIGAEVLVTSAMQNDGIEKILPYLKEGLTSAFIGSSGVGKSTFINRLLEEERLEVNGLRNDDKGRHTTTRRELILLPTGGLVIDTPGMREIGMWDADSGLDLAFSDIEALAEGCRFRDCRHGSEPGCAVRAAISRGELPEERFLSFQRLSAENAYARDSESYLAAKEKKFKDIAKFSKSLQKSKE